METSNSSRMLTEEEIKRLMLRPSIRSCVEEGMHKGTIDSVVVKEIDSKFSETGKRIVLNIKVLVEDEESEEEVALYLAPNFTWSSKGRLIKTLQDLEALPETGGTLDIDAMVGMKVKVVVENVEKDGIEYSNIITMKKAKESKVLGNKNRKVPSRKPILEDETTEFDDFNYGEEDEVSEIEE
jgi:hypothetical protein